MKKILIVLLCLLQANAHTQEATEENETVFQLVETMPEYPGGISECMKYITSNIQYPATAYERGIEGKVVIQFVVERDGSISEPQIARSIDPELDEEALRVIRSMPKWEPGRHQGKTVRVRYTIPVTYKIAPKPDETQENLPAQDNITAPDIMPQFPGGMANCLKFLAKNVKYPTISMKRGVQGRVIVQFIVDEDGNITEPTVIRSLDAYTDKEAVRVIRSMPKWEPGYKDGKAVRVKYTVPVGFKLGTSSKKSKTR